MSITETFGNLLKNTLSAAVTSTTATAIHVDDPTVFPASMKYRIRIDREFMLVTGGQGTSTLTVTRGVDQSVAALHDNGSNVYQVLTADAIHSQIEQHDHSGGVEGVSVGGNAWFGDASDGSVTIATDTVLTRNMYYSNLLINSGARLDCSNYLIFATESFTNYGTVHCDGGDGGAVPRRGYFSHGGVGNSGYGTPTANSLGGSASSPGQDYWGPRSIVVVQPPKHMPHSAFQFLGVTYDIPVQVAHYVPGDPWNGIQGYTWYSEGSGSETCIYSGGAGGGGADGLHGGTGGGIVFICAKRLLNYGTISANGGKGDNPNSPGAYYPNAYGGGGGALILLYRFANWNVETVNGGLSASYPNQWNSAYAGSPGNIFKLNI